jgi:NADPH:quinone reductase
MKAILCKQFGLPEILELTEVPSPQAGPNQVVITVKACGINFPDTLIIQNKYQFKPPLPFSPGGEVSGIVKAIGEGVKHLKVGDNVFAMTGWGGFAEEVVADAATTLLIPAEMDYVTAATTMYTYCTSYHALKDRAKLQPNETLLIMGAAGGVGLAAVQLGVLMGAKVIAVASTDEKLSICQSLGASDTINYLSEDFRKRVNEITNGKGVDVVYDAVGDKFSEPALRSMAWKGRFLVVGFAAGEPAHIPLNLALLKGCDILGVFWGSFTQKEPLKSMQNIKDILTWIGNGQLKQHIHGRYKLEEAPIAVREMMDRKVVGKAVLLMNG